MPTSDVRCQPDATTRPIGIVELPINRAADLITGLMPPAHAAARRACQTPRRAVSGSSQETWPDARLRPAANGRRAAGPSRPAALSTAVVRASPGMKTPVMYRASSEARIAPPSRRCAPSIIWTSRPTAPPVIDTRSYRPDRLSSGYRKCAAAVLPPATLPLSGHVTGLRPRRSAQLVRRPSPV